MSGGSPVCSPSSIPTVKPSGPVSCDGDSLPVRDLGKMSIAGVAKMLPVAGAGASLSLAGGGECLVAADRAELLAVAVGAGTSSVAIGREAFLVAGGGAPWVVADGGEAKITGGGYIGTSGATVGGDDEPLAVAGLRHRLRPPHWQVAGVGEPCWVTKGGGASEV